MLVAVCCWGSQLSIAQPQCTASFCCLQGSCRPSRCFQCCRNAKGNSDKGCNPMRNFPGKKSHQTLWGLLPSGHVLTHVPIVLILYLPHYSAAHRMCPCNRHTPLFKNTLADSYGGVKEEVTLQSGKLNKQPCHKHSLGQPRIWEEFSHEMTEADKRALVRV